jgi:hypothetical protein
MDLNRPIKRPHPPALGCVVVLFITLVPAYTIIKYTRLDGVRVGDARGYLPNSRLVGPAEIIPIPPLSLPVPLPRAPAVGRDATRVYVVDALASISQPVAVVYPHHDYSLLPCL